MTDIELLDLLEKIEQVIAVLNKVVDKTIERIDAKIAA